MPRDAAATKDRILSAAVEEFSAVGLAGGRVDRIAEAASSNKRMIYVYFGDKEGLFSAALQKALGELMSAVPVTEDDLPGYAGALFDYVIRHPQAWRLSMWRQLERPGAGPQAQQLYREKVLAMQGAVAPGGTIAGLPAVDLLVLVQAMAGAWLVSPVDLLTADGSDPASAPRLAEHRRALVEAVRRLTPGSGKQPR